jgi:hypothetical protein
MYKPLALIGASVFALGIMVEGVEAKKVYYEIDGQRYSYSTNNREQVATARKRIEAAKAKAESERAGNVFVSIFKSQPQAESATPPDPSEQTGSIRDQTAVSKLQRPSRMTKDERRKSHANGKAREPTRSEAKWQSAALKQDHARPRATSEPQPSVAAEPLNPQAATTPMIKSVSFDVGSGIKTTIMTDGSILEELFDSSMLSKLASEQGVSGSLTDYVNQLRKASASETTASTLLITAQPD